jgi:hypothetical protein
MSTPAYDGVPRWKTRTELLSLIEPERDRHDSPRGRRFAVAHDGAKKRVHDALTRGGIESRMT